jgi:hypothetical protein
MPPSWYNLLLVPLVPLPLLPLLAQRELRLLMLMMERLSMSLDSMLMKSAPSCHRSVDDTIHNSCTDTFHLIPALLHGFVEHTHPLSVLDFISMCI